LTKGVNQREFLLKSAADELKIDIKKVESVIGLLEEGNTVPFIARYRKEQTGALDEVQIRTISEHWTYLLNLQNRKDEVIRLIEEQGKLTPDLQRKINQSTKLQQVEDLYRPYKQKRRTKATIAKEKGLEPFAQWIMAFPLGEEVRVKAREFISVETEVLSEDEAIQGAVDIIAENISDDPAFRQWIRQETFRKGKLASVVKNKEKDEKNLYEMYYKYEEAIGKVVPHRILAMNRGEKEDILRVSIIAPVESIVQYLHKKIIKTESSSASVWVKKGAEEAYKRLIEPSVEREIRKELAEKAEERAIHIFSENLKNLLLQPPLKGKMVLGVDPAYRTGCKLALVDETGKMLAVDVIYPHPPVNKMEKAREKLLSILQEYKVEIVAVGNGTASRETEQFVADTLRLVDREVMYLIVNEAGASVYSASDVAREEFPNLQVEERSAVSIARRLQDPLAELVKIEPKSVGVGQYQHDVSQKKLSESLHFVVETAVNQVGVNVNTASSSLLQYVAGLNKTVAQNIVKYREENGKFTTRKELKNIPRLGSKTYEQCIGFLRIIDGQQPLDRTSIHPESYAHVQKLLNEIDFSVQQLGDESLKRALERLDKTEAARKLNIGGLTLGDIIGALIQPERDPRDDLPKPLLKKEILQLEDLSKGLELEGTVRNVVDFGVFVDIGVKQDGLVHISKLSRSYVKHPLDIVSVGDLVTVWVEDVDMKKGRVALSMVHDA
jgi:uncharacterized protein